MSGQIVLYGATGYTGGLVARSLTAAGERPRLAGRNRESLRRLATELGGAEPLDTVVADATADPRPLREALGAGDVLVTTVGPFLTRGRPALDAAIATGAHYLDSTGEPPFVRAVFEQDGARAAGRNGLLTAFGYDYVPGNLAGALALADAGPAAVRIDIGYFLTGRAGRDSISTGTLASLAGVVAEPGFGFRAGRLVTERPAARVRSFPVGRSSREGLSLGGSEHFALPRLAPQLRDVSVHLGWFGPLSRVAQAGSLAGSLLRRLPGADAATKALVAPLARRTGGGPDEDARRAVGSHVVAVAYGAAGSQLAEVHLTGVNPYTFTGDILTWGAREAAAGRLQGTGALGPVDGFGLEALMAGCAEAGLTRAG